MNPLEAHLLTIEKYLEQDSKSVCVEGERQALRTQRSVEIKSLKKSLLI